MNQYHKIQTVYKRDPATKYKTLMEGDYSLPEFKLLENITWTWTEKVDGTNIRVIFDGEKFSFAGKTDKAQTPPFLLNVLEDMFMPKFGMYKEHFPDGFCFYGEGYGPKIQKGGGLYRKDVSFVLFDVKIGPWWLKRNDVEDIGKALGIDIVPVIGEGTLPEMVEFVRNGFNSTWGNFLAEGVVAKPAIDLISRNGKRIVTKLKHKDFRR